MYQIPRDIEAEQIVLGYVLVSSRNEKVLRSVSSSDFYKEEHRKIFDAMVDLHKSNKPVDILSVFKYFKDRHIPLKAIGGGKYLIFLANIVPLENLRRNVFSSSVERYITRIRRNAMLRRKL